MPAEHESPMQSTIQRYHDVMPNAIKNEWTGLAAAGLRALVDADGVITVGSGCSGTDIAVVALECLLGFLCSWLSIAAKVKHLFVSELNADKRRFLMSQFKPEHVFENVSSFSSHRATDLLSGLMVVNKRRSYDLCVLQSKDSTAC